MHTVLFRCLLWPWSSKCIVYTVLFRCLLWPWSSKCIVDTALLRCLFLALELESVHVLCAPRCFGASFTIEWSSKVYCVHRAVPVPLLAMELEVYSHDHTEVRIL